MTSGIARIVRFPMRLNRGLDWIIIRTSVDDRNFSRSEASRGHIGNVRSSSDARDYTARSDGRWTPRRCISARFRSRSHRDRDLNRKTHMRTRGTLWRVRFSSNRDLHRTAGKTSGRSPRSWRDRTAIAVRSTRDHDSFVAESPPRFSKGVQWWIEITINPRSWLDRGAIVALLEVKLKLIHRQIKADSARI